MDIIRVTNPDEVKDFKQYFTLADSKLIDQLVFELTETLRNLSDSILFLKGVDPLDRSVKVVLVAVNPGAVYSYITVSQLWVHPKTDPNWTNTFLPRLIMWAVALNKTYMRAETTRNAEAMYRRFGFFPWITVLKYDLVKSGYFDLLTKRPEEVLQWDRSLSPSTP